MKIIGKYAIAIMVLAALIGLGACKVDVTELLVADNGATINYTGMNNTLSHTAPPYARGPATLTVINDINSNVFRIVLYNAVASPISDDLLGSFDCIGAGRTNIVRGVPKLNGDLYVYFADNNTDSVIFSNCLFLTNDYTLTIQIDTSSVNVLVASNIAQAAGTSIQQIVKGGIVYTLAATPK